MKNSRAFSKPGLGIVFAAVLAMAGCASRTPAPVFERSAQPSAAPVDKSVYVVKAGDTLYSISRDHGMDHRELIAMNNIESPDRITPGKILKVRPPADASSPVASTAPITSDVVVARPIGGDQRTEKGPLGGNTETLKREPKVGKEPYSDQALALAQSAGQAKSAESAVPAAIPGAKTDKPADKVSGGEETGWIWPVAGKIVATFSEGGSKGVDVAGKTGDPVAAVGDGRVILANNTLRGYGNMVVIKHTSTLLTVYAHNSKILVKEGQNVTRGQKIAEMGNTDADQVKLHFEVRLQGKPVDPLKYLPPR